MPASKKAHSLGRWVFGACVKGRRSLDAAYTSASSTIGCAPSNARNLTSGVFVFSRIRNLQASQTLGEGASRPEAATISEGLHSLAKTLGCGAKLFMDGPEPLSGSKDYERVPETGEAFLYVAMTRLMVRRLARL